MAEVHCEYCGAVYDDAERLTYCPHDGIMPAADMQRKKAALSLLGKPVCFAHQSNGPSHQIQSVSRDGMITLYDMVGEFAPDLFVIADVKD